jgi:uncharacterized protein (DUF2236 family)
VSPPISIPFGGNAAAALRLSHHPAFPGAIVPLLRLTPVSALRAAIAGQIIQMVGSPEARQREAARRDLGLFGPDSICWKVHGDFTSMMIGGITALLMQMLHPRALAGVWGHSNFRNDMAGRLKRTAGFIAGTTYGDRAEAQALIDQVREVHSRVVGRLPDGTPYAASDPDLLTWVHVAEVSSFLAAYLRYADRNLPPVAQDQYFREAAAVAFKLGARDVPQSRAEIAAYLEAVRPQLRYDERTRSTAKALLAADAPSAAAAPALSLTFDAAKDLLPPWAAQMHGFELPGARRATVRLAMKGLGRTLRWALVDSAEARARRRAAQWREAEAP